MTSTRLRMIVGLVGTGAALTLTAGAGTAMAADAEGTALATIVGLRADGNQVIVNKVGSGSLESCTITSVQSMSTKKPPTVNPLTGVPDFTSGKTVHVNLKC
jgi:hypothetical protein